MSMSLGPSRADDAGRPEPILRVETDGPLSLTTSLAFDRTGQLLVAGFDKVVRRWRWDDVRQAFSSDGSSAIRIPIGPGLQGSINAMAASADGEWLAVAGRGRIRGTYSFRDQALVVPAGSMTDDMRLDEGVIHLIHLPTGRTSVLRGHTGSVVALTFVAGNETQLASLGIDGSKNSSGNDLPLSAMAWRLSEQQPVARRDGFKGLANLRPSLAAWENNGQLQLAVASGLDVLEVWDVTKNQSASVKIGPYCSTVILSPDRKSLAVGCYGSVQKFDLAKPLANGVAVAKRPVPSALTVGLTVVDAPTGWLLNALMIDDLGKANARVALRGLRGSDLADVRTPIDLWSVGAGAAYPALATSADGRRCAVAGRPDQQVLILDLIDPKAGLDNAQPLETQAISFSKAVLARKENDWGLLLTGADGSTRVLDVSHREFVPPAGWRVDEASNGGWSLKVAPGQPDKPIALRSPAGSSLEVPIPAGHSLQASAVFVDPRHPDDPIVARATMYQGESHLELVPARLGQAVRRLSGQTSAIINLSFNEDGRFLVTTCADRAVRVYALKDLRAEHLGKRGGLPGVTVADRDGSLTVVDVRDATTNASLRVGDIIRGLDQLGEVESIKSVDELVNRLAGFEPGREISLHLTRAGQEIVQAVKLGQAVDERNPLFSVLALRGKAGADKSWIGWSSLGPYEASESMPDQFLGWHFNEIDGDVLRARFAPIREYREAYIRTGLLKRLLEAGEASQEALRADAPPIARPNITVAVQVDDQDRQPILNSRVPVLVRKPSVRLWTTLIGPGSERIREVEWRSGEKTGVLSLDGDADWRADLPLDDAGTYPVEISMTTDESSPQIFTESFSIQYRPSPPEIVAHWPEANVVRAETLPIEFSVRQPDGLARAVEVRVSVQQGSDESLIAEESFEKAEKSLRESVPLRPGLNVITLSATAAADDSGEAAVERFAVTYNPLDVSPPTTESNLFKTNGEPLTLAGGLIRVDEPVIVIGSRVVGQESLLKVQAGISDQLQDANGFKPGAGKEFSFRQPVTLRPGKQTIVVSARTEASVERRQEWTVEYQPPVPTVAVLEPANGTFLADARGRDQIKLRATTLRSRSNEPFEVDVTVNGTPVEGLTVDPANRSIEGEVPIRPGDNKIDIRVHNQWGAESWASATVTRRCPPSVAESSPILVPDESRADLSLVVESVPERPPTTVTLDDLERSAEITPIEGKPGRWNVVLRDIPLEQGENRWSIRVANADGWSPSPALLAMDYAPPPPPKATFAKMEPTSDVVSTNPAIDVSFALASESPVEQVTLFVGGQAVWKAPETVTTAQDYRVPVALKPGINAVCVVVRNAGGDAEHRLNVNYVPPPARVIAQAVETRQGLRQPLVGDASGSVRHAQPMDTAEAVVHGRVEVFGRKDRSILLAAWVNGFRQPPVMLAPTNSTADVESREFSIPVLLDREGENLVQLTLPDDAEDDASGQDIVISCDNPARDRELYVIAISPNLEVETEMSPAQRQQFETDLRERVLKVVGAAEGIEGRRLTTPVFSSVVPFVLTGRVADSRIGGLLGLLSRRLRTTDRRQPAQRAVLVLCEGQLVSPEGGGREDSYLVPSNLNSEELKKIKPEMVGFAPERLVGSIARMPGAHIVCFEVREAIDESIWAQAGRPADGLNLAMLRMMSTNTVSLLDAMEQGIATKKTLGDVDDFLQQAAVGNGPTTAQAIYDSLIPRPLIGMVVGPTR